MFLGHCGKFYHLACLKYYPQTIYNQGVPNKKHVQQNRESTGNADSPSNLQILSCPHHLCHTCNSENILGTKSKHLYEKLVKCIECPSAYHTGNYCIPAGSQVNIFLNQPESFFFEITNFFFFR